MYLNAKKQDTQTRERKYYSYLIFLAMPPFWLKKIVTEDSIFTWNVDTVT